MAKSDEIYVKHILDAINRIEGYMHGYSYVDFVSDPKTVNASIREIEVIGEASRNLSTEFKQKHKAVPWNLIVGYLSKN